MMDKEHNEKILDDIRHYMETARTWTVTFEPDIHEGVPNGDFPTFENTGDMTIIIKMSMRTDNDRQDRRPTEAVHDLHVPG